MPFSCDISRIPVPVCGCCRMDSVGSQCEEVEGLSESVYGIREVGSIFGWASRKARQKKNYRPLGKPLGKPGA